MKTNQTHNIFPFCKMIALCSIIFAFTFVACSEKDDLEPDIDGPDVPVSEIPTEDIIKTHIEVSVATIGSNFDETTERLIARARGGVSVSASNASDVPEGTGVVIIDSQSLERIMTSFESGDYREIVWLNHLFQNGSVMMLHKPDDTAAALFTLLLQWDSFVQNPDGTYSMGAGDLSNFRAKKQDINSCKIQSRADDNKAINSLDLYGIRDGYHYYCVPNVYEPGISWTTQGTKYSQVDEEEVETEVIVEENLVANQPSPYKYGLMAEEGVKWINQTSEEIQAKGMKTMMSRADVTGDIQFFDQVASTTYTVNENTTWKNHIPGGWMPVTFRFWISPMYNFEKDEDYYHVVMEETIPAQLVYHGIITAPDLKNWKICGFTVNDFFVSAYFSNSDTYPIKDHWNALPQGQASPTTYESVNGWEVNAEVSIGKGVTGKLGGKYQSKETITTTREDVEVTYQSNLPIDNYKRFEWHYVLGNQPEFTGRRGKLHYPSTPDNASCRSEQKYRQSWNWLIGSTQARGNVPFNMSVRFALHFRWCEGLKLILETIKDRYTYKGYSDNENFEVQLPVPERFKKVYSFTLDNSSDASELSNLLSVMEKVVPNFNGLFQALQRTDDNGVLLGRTGTSITDIENTVGAEWYALAKEIAARKFGVKNTYRFYVKDMSTATDGKLQMRVRENGAWKDMGVYVEVGPNGSRILTQAEADAEDAKK